MDYSSPYKTRFIWSGSDFRSGSLSLVRCDTDGIPPESSIVNWIAQKIDHEQYHASLTVNVKNTLKLRKKRYFYMDVGKWLNGFQYFGVVCGRVAVICEYSANGGSGEIPPDVPHTGLLHHFLKSGGIRPDADRCRLILPPYQGDPNHLYVIIPDVHLPQAVLPDEEEKRLRWNVYRRLLQIQEPDYGRGRDVFGSLKSADALAKFLTQVATFSSDIQSQLPDARVTLLQIGDMYELWGHRPLCYQQRERAEVVLSEPHENSARQIGEWISGTHFLHQEIFDAFDKCKAELSQCIFLHGNHDSYLSVPDVVRAANRWQTELPTLAARKFPGGDGWGAHYKTTTIHSRVRDFRAPEGIYFEHGQRVDKYNRDGETSGQASTNAAVSIEPLKALDSTRRETFVTGASTAHLLRQGDFGLYVMGHTHEPQLKPVEISHYTDDNFPVELPPLAYLVKAAH